MSRKDAAINKARNFGEIVAYEEFIVMLNPKYRGGKFQWSEFVNWCARRSESCWQAFSASEWEKWKPELKQAAREAAEAKAQSVLKSSGIMEWWPDPTRSSEGGRRHDTEARD